MGAREKLPVDDGAAADAGADGQIEQVAHALSCTEAPLGQGSQVGVVSKPDRASQTLGKQLAQGHTIPAWKVGSAIHDALNGVRGTRSGDPGAGGRDVPDSQVPDGIHDAIDDSLRTFVCQGENPPGLGWFGLVRWKEGRPDVRATEIDGHSGEHGGSISHGLAVSLAPP